MDESKAIIRVNRIKGFIVGFFVSLLILTSAVGGAIADRLFVIKPLDYFVKRVSEKSLRVVPTDSSRVVNEESVVIEVAERVSPSVVTVSIQTPRRRILEFDPFSGFRSRIEGGKPQDIGTGFVVSSDGLIVTNKHVVADTNSSYKVITKDGKEYEVKNISRDPSNDLAVLKIDASGLKPVELGDSDSLKVGQFVIAIGTALGEFRHTVTTGVISGLGRGIEAGNPFEGYVERLDDVIQTDAAINPGNSGGPLLNSAGQVIGVNVAVASGAQNIGFALPVNVLKDALKTFSQTGSFASRPFLGVEYQMISKQAAILNEVPQGALVLNIVSGSPAEKAGIQEEDIIVKIDGEEIKEEGNGLVEIISKKKPGQEVELEIWRNGETIKLKATLSEMEE
jgi:S1-C subfamily serine protease